jgi:hypothetical protein
MSIYGHAFDNITESNVERVLNEKGIIHDIIKGIKNLTKKNKENSMTKSSKKVPEDGNYKYEIKEITSKSGLDMLYRNNDLVNEGLYISNDTDAQAFTNKVFELADLDCDKLIIYTFTGKLMNSTYDLAGSNKYPDSLHFCGVPLNPFIKDGKYMEMKSRGFRYFNDIVDNNEYREYLAGRHEKSEQIQWLIDVFARKNK